MRHVVAQRLPDRAGIGVMAVGGHPSGTVPTVAAAWRKKRWAPVRVAGFAESGVNQVAVPVDGPVEAAVLAEKSIRRLSLPVAVLPRRG